MPKDPMLPFSSLPSQYPNPLARIYTSPPPRHPNPKIPPYSPATLQYLSYAGGGVESYDGRRHKDVRAGGSTAMGHLHLTTTMFFFLNSGSDGCSASCDVVGIVVDIESA